MKIKQSIYLLALALILLPPLSCKKFLQQTDTSNVAADALFKKPEDAIQLVNALYNTFDEAPYDVMKFSLYTINNYLSQEHLNWGGGESWNFYLFPTNDGAFDGLWKTFYRGIASANAAIPIIAKMRDESVL